MTRMKIVEPRLMWFVQEMREKLAEPKNQAKSDWRMTSTINLMSGVWDEMEELETESPAFNVKLRLDEGIKECADLANRAMMLADKLNEIQKKVHP